MCVFRSSILTWAMGGLWLAAFGATGADAGDAPQEPPATVIGNAAAVTDAEQLAFRQTKVIAQMTELEERMFRLAEALGKLEPENSSRLRLALQFAREQLILSHMGDARLHLKGSRLTDADVAEKQALAKLQRLQELLTSADLDLQMRLEQLRLMKEILRQLDVAVKEERRELTQSKELTEEEERVATLKKRARTLQDLIARQEDRRAAADKLAKDEKAGLPVRQAMSKLSKEQEGLARSAEALAKESSDLGEELNAAAQHMESAAENLKRESDAAKAVPEQDAALEKLKKALKKNQNQLEEAEAKAAAENYRQLQRDQGRNRNLTDAIAQSTGKLGSAGQSALEEMLRASGAMSNAEESLQQRKAGPAGEKQEQAKQSLERAREQLAAEAERMKQEMHGEVRARVIAALEAMIEKQVAVRVATERAVTLPPAAGSSAVIAQGSSEQAIVKVLDETLDMVETAEFAIALPAALKVARRGMTDVQAMLESGEATPATVAAEQRVEADLKALLDAMNQLPDTRQPPKSQSPQQPSSDQERELNRLIAELKMIRWMQVRVNGETQEVDGRRPPNDAELNSILREAVREVTKAQDDVRSAMQKIAPPAAPREEPWWQVP